MDEQLSLTSERSALSSFLDQQREGLIKKILGLDDPQARSAPTASALSLLGLIKHAATWEERWFHVVMAGGESSDGWPEVRPEPRDADCFVDESDTVQHWVGRYRQEIERSHAVVAARELDDPCARADIIVCNVRYVLFHLIEETARHAGHADIIRESIDGSRGF
ncbi:DinB family protein [Nakamurella sp. A5-74]|uniref:DinB family protein n=1 Tax=Nakamurella sp. A5-74 TaxID=3158264 RepID=A0AAU8DSI8_9ACTN